MIAPIWVKVGSSNGLLPGSTKPWPSHQCWFLTSSVLWHSPKSNFTASAQATILYNEFENDMKWLPHLPGTNELMNNPSLPGVLLPEMVTCLVLLQMHAPTVLQVSHCEAMLQCLLDLLDKFNRLAPGWNRDDHEDLSWPGIWSKDTNANTITVKPNYNSQVFPKWS